MGKIDNRQLVALLFISRIFSVLTFNPKADPRVEGAVSMFGTVLVIPLTLLCALPLFLLLRERKENGYLESAYALHPLWGKACAVCTGIICLLVAINTSSNFQYFLATAVYPDLEGTVFVLVFVLTVAYAVYMGLEAFARISVLMASLVLVSTVLVVVALTKDFNMAFLHSPFEHGWEPINEVAYQGVVSYFELLAFGFLAPKVRGKNRKGFGWVVALAGGYYLLILFTAAVTLGDYGYTQTFPIYAMMASAELTLIQRLDALHMALWVFIAFIKCTLFFHLSQASLATLLPREKRPLALPLVGGVMLVCCLFIALRLESLIRLLRLLGSGIPFFLTVVALPLVTYLGLLWQKKRKGAKV